MHIPPAIKGYTLRDALDHSSAWADLARRVQASRERLEVVRAALPPSLRAAVRAGPLDEEGWLLLVDNGAIAAKLRQWQPALEKALRARGWVEPLRLRVLPRQPL